MKNINIALELSSLNLRNLQLLNISNNVLCDLNISSTNFPNIKEIYASRNLFKTAKAFVKLDTIKLLDLQDNCIADYEEIVCLAFI
jgi:Leucine-rich repeat (LRR) protein